jgi:hypothetical protein
MRSLYERGKIIFSVYVQCKSDSVTGPVWPRGWVRGIALLLHDRGTRRGWVVSSTPRSHFTPGKDPVPILQEAVWAPGPVWTGWKSRPHRDSIPYRPARSHSLYRPANTQSVEKPKCWSDGYGDATESVPRGGDWQYFASQNICLITVQKNLPLSNKCFCKLVFNRADDRVLLHVGMK